MSKLRVHELAKQLDKSSKELIQFLTDNNIEVKGHMSTLEEGQIQMVNKAFRKGPAAVNQEKTKDPEVKTISTQMNDKKTEDTAIKPEQAAANVEKKAAAPEQAGSQEKKEAEQAAPKKKNITQVFHPQNSQNPALRGRQGQQNRRGGAPGQRPAGIPGQRPAGVQGQRPAGAQGQRPTGAVPGQRPAGAQGQRPAGAVQGQRPAGTQGQRPAGVQSQNPAAVQQPRPQNTPVQKTQGNDPRTGTTPSAAQKPATEQRSGTNMQTQRSGAQNDSRDRRPAPSRNVSGQAQGGQRPSGGQNAGRNTRQDGRDGQRPANRNNNQRPAGNRTAGPGNTGRQNTRPASARQSGNEPLKLDKLIPQDAGNRGKTERDRKSTASDNRNNRFDKAGKGPDTRQANRPNQGGGNRPNQGGGRRPNQGGGNRPNQRRRNQRPNQRPSEKPMQAASVEKEEIKTIILPDTMTIRELADKMKIQAAVIVKKLFLQGTMVTVNQEIDYDMAEEIALEYNCIAEHEVKVDVIEELLKEEEEDKESLEPRPPVVCVMGHVDHGKTSLLDAIRNTHVIDREAGGITQHIGAYVVSIEGQKITFLDTPGHEAFTAMRMRGANATDIAILVVAADDGVMPQTIEAINHAKAAGIEIIVAINKIDKPSANIERVKQELSEYELIPEDWGGSTIFVPVSAHTHEGMEQLLEMILLTAEVGELKANPKRRARGLVIEAELDKGKGPVATILVQKGTLSVGDPIAAGSCYGKVRAMMDDKGRRVKHAGPSIPVEILGLSDVPNAGEIFVAPETDKEARSFAETFISEGRERLLEETKSKMSLNDLFSQIQAGNLKELGIIVKADVQGSVEAVKQSLLKLSNEEVVVKIIHGGVGAINESDVILASTSNAIIIGFNVRPDATAKTTADQEGVDMRLYRVIYDAISDVEAAMKGLLDPVFEEKVLGHAQVRQTFKASGIGTIAGAYVLDGIFQRGCSVRVTRNDDLIFEGPLASLKRFKDDVKEVKTGYECGLVFENFNDVKEDDMVEAYTMVEVPR